MASVILSSTKQNRGISHNLQPCFSVSPQRQPHVLKLQTIVFSCPKSVTNQFIGGNPVTETQICFQYVYIYIYTKDIRYFQLLVKKFRPLYKPLRKKQEAVSFLSKPPVFTSVLAGLGIARIGTLFGGEEHPIIGMLRVPRHGASQGPVIGCQPWMNKPRLRLFFIGKVPFNLSIRWNDSWGNIPLIFINYDLAKSGVDINWIYHIEFMKPNDFLSRVDEIIGG